MQLNETICCSQFYFYMYISVFSLLRWMLTVQLRVFLCSQTVKMKGNGQKVNLNKHKVERLCLLVQDAL